MSFALEGGLVSPQLHRPEHRRADTSEKVSRDLVTGGRLFFLSLMCLRCFLGMAVYSFLWGRIKYIVQVVLTTVDSL